MSPQISPTQQKFTQKFDFLLCVGMHLQLATTYHCNLRPIFFSARGCTCTKWLRLCVVWQSCTITVPCVIGLTWTLNAVISQQMLILQQFVFPFVQRFIHKGHYCIIGQNWLLPLICFFPHYMSALSVDIHNLTTRTTSV